MTSPNTATVGAADIAELDNLLGDLNVTPNTDADLDELIEAVDHAVGNISPTAIDDSFGELELNDQDLRKMEAQINREEAYADQESTVTATPVTPTTKTVVPPKAKAQRASTPRVARDLKSIAAEHFVLEGGVPADAAAAEAMKDATMKLIPAQKKVAEKFENLFQSVAVGKAPSTFIVIAFNLLDKNGALSSADLVAAYKTVGAKSETEGYNEGTARSQAGQIMNLFDAVKIATRAKQALTLNTESRLASKLRDILNPAAPAA